MEKIYESECLALCAVLDVYYLLSGRMDLHYANLHARLTIAFLAIQSHSAYRYRLAYSAISARVILEFASNRFSAFNLIQAVLPGAVRAQVWLRL